MQAGSKQEFRVVDAVQLPPITPADMVTPLPVKEGTVECLKNLARYAKTGTPVPHEAIVPLLAELEGQFTLREKLASAYNDRNQLVWYVQDLRKQLRRQVDANEKAVVEIRHAHITVVLVLIAAGVVVLSTVF